VPGPGAYTQQASESKNGFIVNSRYKSSAKAVISRGKSRFDNTSMRTSAAIPGPGLYNLKLDLNMKGNYSFARYRNSGAPVFTKGKRDTNLDTSVTRKRKNHSTNFSNIVTPGPGSYRMQSDFGYYNINASTLSNRPITKQGH